MKKDINEKLYQTALLRIDELLHEVTDETPVSDKRAIELSLMSDIVMAYEEKHFPIASSPLADVMKIALEEKNISQKALAERIGVSPSRISEYLSGKAEPTLKIARAISKELKIAPAIVLGV
ncbi:MAG: helix-turn-helix domain-containing protein [Paludibacter sp.]